MDATLPGDHALHLDSAAREEWVANCEAAYPAVYRALIAIGASEDALKQRRAVTSAQGWLFVVAQRRWRRSRWRQRIFHPLELVRGSIRSDRENGIDLLVELRRLTERQRTVIVARYVLGLSQREIAELLGIAPGTVAATAHQATAVLRERLLGGMK